MREEIHMKKQKVCALLCVAALSISSVTPAMAADLAETPQVEAGTEEQQEVVTDQANKEAPEGVSREEETQEEVDQKTIEEPVASGDESTAEIIGDEQGVPEETVCGDGISNDAAPVTDQGTVEGDEEDGIPTDGWYTDEDGNTYYYENGEKLQEVIVEIEDEDGSIYGYYFNEEGVMAVSGTTWISYYDEESQTWISGQIYADDNGHLYKGWNQSPGPGKAEYYGDDYIAYCEKFLQDGDVLYYFDESGYRVKNKTIIVNGIMYKADSNGALTVQDTSANTGWQMIDGSWYYYKDGEILKDTYATIRGTLYYFNSDGTMATGVFYDEKLGYNRLAEPSGKVVSATGWYQSPENKKWYWFDEKDVVTIGSLKTINGKQFYFDENGIMRTGSFWANYEDENGEWISTVLFADQYGAISKAPGWKQIDGIWYYVKGTGEAAANEIIDVKGKSYYFDENGIMQTGFISAWDGAREYTYVADASGVLIKNQWVKKGIEWYYTDASGAVCTNQWLKNGMYYVGATGVMAIGSKYIDGKWYVFDENGRKQATIGEKNGWQLIEGIWYYAANGEPYNGWLNHSYYFVNGKMITDRTVPAEHNSEQSCYLGSDGTVQTGWLYQYGSWHYAAKDAKTGDTVLVEDDWKKINGKWYYFDSIYMVENTLMKIGGQVSRFASGGAWQGYVNTTGWVSVGGEWYYINTDGTLNTEDKVINGHMYHFGGGTAMIRQNFFEDNDTGDLYWINQDGIIDTTPGWKQDRWGNWYYVKNGKLVTGTQTINGTTYDFFGGNGCMEANTYGRVGDTLFLYDKDGKRTPVSDGWYLNKETTGNVWYYFKDGMAYEGNIGQYYVEYGKMVCEITRSWTTDSTYVLYMYDDNGHLVTNRWIYRWGHWYYAGVTGKLYTGTCYVNGKAYLFNSEGEMVKEL